MSKFMYIFRGGGVTVQPPLAPAEVGAHLAKWTAWLSELIQAGHAEPGAGALENAGKTLRGRSGTVTDGPFAEAKDLVSGVLFVTAESVEQATEIARGCPIFEYDGSVEVRPLRPALPSHVR